MVVMVLVVRLFCSSLTRRKSEIRGAKPMRDDTIEHVIRSTRACSSKLIDMK